KVYHVNGGTLPANSPMKTYLNFRNNLLMLYKNLSGSEFLKVFVIRVLFDFAAFLHFSLTEGFAHGRAVLNGYRDFFKFKSSMKKTQPLASKLTKHDQEKKVLSIVIAHYLRGRKTFPELINQKEQGCSSF